MPLTLTPRPPQGTFPFRSLWYSAPKAGKTTAVSLLPGHYVLELESSGARYLTIAADFTRTRAEFDAALGELEKLPPGERPAFLVVDTADRLEDFAAGLAMDTYNKRFPKAKLSTHADLTGLDYGLGYGYLREAFRTYLDAVDSLGIPTLYLAHVKPKQMDKELKEAGTDDLALTGRVRDILCAEMDLIAFLTRSKQGHLIATTRTSDTINCGCRLSALSGRDITLIENAGGKLIPHWDTIFPQLAQNVQ